MILPETACYYLILSDIARKPTYFAASAQFIKLLTDMSITYTGPATWHKNNYLELSLAILKYGSILHLLQLPETH